MRRIDIGIEPLWWGDPPWMVLDRTYREARRRIRSSRPRGGTTVLDRQNYLRKVHDEFYRLLDIYGIYVEGAGQS